MKTTIIYWTSTGNTEKMATLIKKGLDQPDTAIEAVIKTVGNSTAGDIRESDVVLLGCPAMGVEELDTSEMEPFIRMNAEVFKGKSIALFGSYGWGDGEWMASWEEMMVDIGAKVEMESLIVNEMPEGQSEFECIDFGKKISRLKI